VWFFQEMTLLTSLLVIAALLAVIFLIGYCVGVLGTGSTHSFWTKLVHFFKHNTPTSFETLAKRDPNGPTIRSSYYKYRAQRKRIKNFWQSAAIILGFKIIVIILISSVFTDNPLKAENTIEITDLDQAIALTQGLAATVESPKQSPESYYFFEKQGEVKEEIITGAELQSIKKNKEGSARLDEFKKLDPESPD
jgi:ABC-type Fe3+-siderophore transport system permease subunit